MTAPVRLATTIVILRPAAVGFEVFMVQRHRASGFLPSAWVFPGGRVDAADALREHPRVRGGEQLVETLGLDPDQAFLHMVAGVRETFEEAGIWIGEGRIPDSERFPLASREDTLCLRDLLERHQATVDLGRLYFWSWWVTPEFERKRYDTRFFLVVVDDDIGRHDDHETVDSGWFSPKTLLETTDQRTFPLAPPTWWTLYELSRHGTIEEVLQAAERRPVRPIQPIPKRNDGTLTMFLPGHAEHPEPGIELMPTSVSLIDGHWVGDGLEFPAK
jgi:8-oxo-dGTP pyrophosphatase MutT (NUDIX family)